MRDRRTPYVWDGDLAHHAVVIDGCYRECSVL